MQGVIAVLATGLLMTLLMAWAMFGSGKNKRREYETMQRMIEEAEGFAGLAEVEAELDSILVANRVGSGQALLLKDRLESRRFNLEDDLAGAATHSVGATEAQTDSDLAIIEQHGQVTSWIDDPSTWTAEQQAWHDQAKQWGGYYDEAGNWVPLQ